MNLVISILGFGNIGRYISGLLLSNKVHGFQINIIDIDRKVHGAILDLEHAAEIFSEHSISYNSQELFNNSDFIFHCAGASVPKGKSRLVTCAVSVDISEAVFKKFVPVKEPKIIVVANPVEIITYLTQKITGLPRANIIGTGTFLDSIRMNYIVKRSIKSAVDVNAVLLGEHGATTFLSEQLSTINGQSFSSFFDEGSLEELMNSVKASAAEIKETQKATIYGVSFCAVRIFESLLSQKISNYPVSTYIPENLNIMLGNSGLYLSLYSELSNKGAKPTESYWPDEKELTLLKKSLDVIAQCIPKKYI